MLLKWTLNRGQRHLHVEWKGIYFKHTFNEREWSTAEEDGQKQQASYDLHTIKVPPIRRVCGCSPQSLSPLSEGEDALVIPASETRHRWLVVAVTLRASLSLANQQIRRDASEESQHHRGTHSLSDVLDREEFSAVAHHAPFYPGRCLWFLKLIDGINKWCQTHHAARLLITSTGARSFFFLSYFLKLIMNWN